MGNENQFKNKTCPFCNEQIPEEAKKCEFCGEWMTKESFQHRSPGTLGHTIAQPVYFSNAQPVSHFIVLSILTFNLYRFFWFYKNLNDLKNHKNLDVSPGFRTLGFIIPIIDIFILYDFAKRFQDLETEENYKSEYSPGFITFGYATFRYLGLLLYTFIDFFTIWPLAMMQKDLNKYWSNEQSDLPIKAEFYPYEVFMLIVGSMIWFFVIIAMFSHN